MDAEFNKEYLAALRRMSPSERWSTARRLYWQARDIRSEVLRIENPSWTDAQIEEAVKKIFMYAGD